ncbi:lysM domain protein [Anoxybacillus sp. B7M1]|uniref:LysM peptidoglycan-binding domain-containing protein n=1 Tax=unclassified Anoxybacillus TaxID=2639704 RepID=UPI0005CCBCCA|nr:MULTISPECIES: LysM peptidoglycan-binding domain-containing protein [unclassified Anoxybacillus]ANB55794.1 lysM domain protein [Anoxybacillus sp. B2M1]ANB63535.1 lysM domain protein [Anoxybacillus sp. B7M1]
MSKSVYEFWFAWPDGTKSRLPVLPSELNISNGSQNESINIAGLGEVTIIQDPAAKTISFSSIFPAQYSPICEYENFSAPWVFVERINMFKKSDKPARFIVTGTPINYPVTIEDFNYKEGEYDVGDISYEITLKEFRFVTVRKVDTRPKSSTVATATKRPNTQTKPKTYTVKKGDTLWALARKFYNDSSQLKKLWEANKDMLIKRDKRNIKQPGHWIYPGQVLKIP